MSDEKRDDEQKDDAEAEVESSTDAAESEPAVVEDEPATEDASDDDESNEDADNAADEPDEDADNAAYDEAHDEAADDTDVEASEDGAETEADDAEAPDDEDAIDEDDAEAADDDDAEEANDEEDEPAGAPVELEIAANPLEVQAVSAPPKPANAAELVTKGLAIKWLDFAVFQVEKITVIYMLMMMSLMMFMEMFYLAIVSEDSKLAGFFIGWVQRMQGGELTDASVAIWETWIVRFEVVGFIWLCYYAAATRFKAKSQVFKLAVGAVICAICVGFAQLVKTQPSNVSYAVLLMVAMAGAGIWWFVTPTETEADQQLRKDRLMSFVATLIAIPIVYVMVIRDLPDDYSFAQHQSLFYLLWVGFVGASMATYQKSHLRIDFVRKMVRGDRAKHAYNGVSTLVTLLFTLILLYVSYDYVFNPDTGAISTPTAEGATPDWIKVLSIPAALAIMALRFTRQTVESFVSAVRGDKVEDALSAH